MSVAGNSQQDVGEQMKAAEKRWERQVPAVLYCTLNAVDTLCTLGTAMAVYSATVLAWDTRKSVSTCCRLGRVV